MSSDPDDQNAQHFKDAVAHLMGAKDGWLLQIEFALGHPAQLDLDFNALAGNYDLIQPFIHQSLTAALTAISLTSFEPACHHKISQVHRILVTLPAAGHPTHAHVEGDLLTIAVRIGEEGPPPIPEAAAAIRAALGAPATESSPAPAPPVPAEDLTPSNPPAEQLHFTHTAEVYQQAAQFMTQLETVMRQTDLWPGRKPEGDIEVRGAFGSENMAFTQWLAWILIPRVRDIIQSQGQFPSHSEISAYARREFDTTPGGDAIADVLMQFDEFIESPG